MSLEDYLNTNANLHAREELLNYRLLFDVKLAAAKIGYHLLTYYSDVDHDGFDVIFDDRHTVRKVQLKTVASTSKTPNWQIHRSILRPMRDNWERLGFIHDGFIHETESGVEGGVILIEYDAQKPDLPITSWYTDIYVITAIFLRHIKRDGKTENAVTTFRQSLVNEKLSDKISVPKGFFVRVETPHHLLSMLALYNADQNNWQNRIVTAGAESDWGPKGQIHPTRLAELISEIPDSLEKACGHPAP